MIGKKISVKKMFFWLTSGMALSMTAIILVSFFLTKNIVVLWVGLALIVCATLWMLFMVQLLGMRLSNFTSELCQILDDMMNRSQEPENVSDRETIFARIHHRLVRLYNILQESNRKVEAERQELQSLVSDISHQVRTPVSNMKMIVDTLLTKSLEEQERNEFLKSVRGQINKLDFLIQALVKTSRLETGVIQLEKEDHFIYDTLAQAMSGIVYSAEQKKIHVSVECPEDVRVSHDSKWTEEAIFNLLDNAVKYTPTGGSVQVSVAQWEMYVEIKVSDTGKGISESNQASIFKRFYREEEIHNQPGVGTFCCFSANTLPICISELNQPLSRFLVFFCLHKSSLLCIVTKPSLFKVPLRHFPCNYNKTVFIKLLVQLSYDFISISHRYTQHIRKLTSRNVNFVIRHTNYLLNLLLRCRYIYIIA